LRSVRPTIGRFPTRGYEGVPVRGRAETVLRRGEVVDGGREQQPHALGVARAAVAEG
jgi:hypothetical protein